MVYLQTARFNGGSLSERMNDLMFRESCACPCFNAGEAFSYFRCRGAVVTAVFDLNDQHRANLLRVLCFTVVIPMLTFIFPLIGCRLENHHIVNGVLLRVSDDDPVLQKT